MADVYLTTANVANFNKTDMELMVSDVLDEAPFLSRLAARTCKGYTFTYAKLTGNPSVGFRAVNNGVENTVSTYTQIVLNLGVLDASWAIDIAAAQADERGADHIIGLEARNHLRQAMFEVEKQIIRGTFNVASNAFNGFANQATMNAAAAAMTINAAGTTASTGSSVYLVRMGEGDVEVLWGQGGEITLGDVQIVERAGATGRFPSYYMPITGWVGAKMGSVYSAARIANLTADSGKGLTDALIARALELFPAGKGPGLIVMNRRSLRQLQSSRTATNPTGAPAPFPSDAFGIPIVVTDAITSTEALIA